MAQITGRERAQIERAEQDREAVGADRIAAFPECGVLHTLKAGSAAIGQDQQDTADGDGDARGSERPGDSVIVLHRNQRADRRQDDADDGHRQQTGENDIDELSENGVGEPFRRPQYRPNIAEHRRHFRQ